MCVCVRFGTVRIDDGTNDIYNVEIIFFVLVQVNMLKMFQSITQASAAAFHI